MIRSIFFILCLQICSCMQAFAQDSLIEPESILTATLKAKEVIIDLGSPEEVDRTLKKIHTYGYLETLVFQGETDEATLKKIIYRLSVLRNLNTLTFKDNDLTNIPENISTLKSLRSLTIEGNNDLDFNDLCKKIKNLSINELNLTDNDLKKTPAAISEITSLRKIQLTGNDRLNYEELMEQLAKLPALTTLALPVNFITEVPKNISLLKSLQVLDVSNNALTELPREISSLKAINNLSIQGNLILNPVKDLEKLKGNDIQFLSLDKEISGEEIAQLKKMFPHAEINFPVNDSDNAGSTENETEEIAVPEKITYTGELKAKRDLTILSGAYLIYPAFFRNLVYNFDTLNFEERHADLRYTNTLERFQNETIRTGGCYLNDRRNHRNGPSGKKNEIWFHMPNSIAYPELKAFSGMYWVYAGEMNKREFKKKFVKKQHKSILPISIKWQDIRILYDKNNSLFTIEMKGKKGFEKFTAYPVQPNIQIEKNQQTYNRRYLMYQKALLRRSQTFNRDQLKAKKRYDANFKKMKGYAWKELQLRMSNEEKLMSADEWLEYYDNIVANEKKAIDNSSLVSGYISRAFLLREYSTASSPNQRTVVNNVYSMKNINADFTDDKGLGKLAVATIWIIDNHNKSVSSCTGSLGISTTPISIKPFASYSLIVQLRNGDFGVVTAEQLDKNYEPDKTTSLKVKVFDKNLNTIGELLKADNIQ